MAVAWDRLVRYRSKTDAIGYGDPVTGDDGLVDVDSSSQAGTLRVKVLKGKTPYDAKPTGEEEEVAELLGPLTPQDVSIVRCIGINYKTHIHELGFDLPKVPTMFQKPATAIADTRQPVPIPKIAQAQCDFEGELTIVIGKDCKNVSPEQALDYVAGYVVGDDVSCRDWQIDKEKAGYMPQWCFSKSFDKYAPLGPCIVSTKILGDAKGLRLRTYLNGKLRQDSNTSDLVFGVREIVSFLSTGTTLLAGSVIMTGTPAGVCLGMKPTPIFLKDGDEVTVEIEKIGKLVNTMKFEQ